MMGCSSCRFEKGGGHYKKKTYYLQIFTHGSESVGKFSITYEQHYLRTLPTDSESVGKFSITYQLLPTDLITYQLLPTNLYYLPPIIIIIIYIILKILI